MGQNGRSCHFNVSFLHWPIISFSGIVARNQNFLQFSYSQGYSPMCKSSVINISCEFIVFFCVCFYMALKLGKL